jgi:hypothetical protein
MNRLFTALSVLSAWVLLVCSSSTAQVNLYTETFGSLTSPALPTGWSVTPNTVTWNTATSAPSGGYPGASAVSNLIASNTGSATNSATYNNALSTLGFSNITVMWGARRTSSFTNTITFEWSSDGSTWNPESYTEVINTGTWALVNSGVRILLPPGAAGQPNLQFRWTYTQIGGSGNYRIDDFTVEGTPSNVFDGAGTATLINNAGLFAGSQVFGRNLGGQSVLVTVTGISVGDLDVVVLNVPSGWTGLVAGNVTLGGAFSGNTPVVVGNTLTINAAVLGATPGSIEITGLTTPNPVGALLNGNDTWVVQTAIVDGTPANIAVSPKSYTIIPIQNIRSGGADGFGNTSASGDTSMMNGQSVAVSGVATVENQIISSSSTQSSFFIQEGGYGMQVFWSAAPVTTWTRGDNVVALGSIDTFRGSTEVNPFSGSAPHFFNTGAGSLPSPMVVGGAGAIAEQHEGKLVRVNNVTWDSVGRAFSSTVGPINGFRTAPTDSSTLFLSSTNAIAGSVIPASGDVVGIVYHRADIVNGTRPHKLAARDLFDIVSSLADGSGTASLSNATAGTFNGSTIFQRNAGSQSVTVSITGLPSGNLDKVKLTVPAGWGSYSSANVSVGGAFTGNTPAFSGNDIQINGANLGTTAGTITITGLTSPNPVGPGLSGANDWQVMTAVGLGTLTNIVAQPASHTIIPIQNLRTGGVDGFGNSDAGGTIPVLNNAVVAVQGVITVPNRVLAETTSTNIVIQDGNFGVQVYRGGAQSHTTLLQGNLIVVKGAVSVFHGNTEIQPTSVTAPNIFNLGAGSLPAAQLLSSAVAIAESTESRLVSFASVNWDSAGQLFMASGSSASDNNFRTGPNPGTIYLYSVNEITGTVIPASSPMTGVVHQRDDMVGGGQQAYKIAPRNLSDLSSGPMASVLAGWNMISNPVTTASDSLRQLFGSNAAFPYAFAFASGIGYQQDYTLENGRGYWAKFLAPDTRSFTGGLRTLDTIDVVTGWNMVGSISSAVDTSTIVSLPPGIRPTTNYWYGYSGSYAATTSLLPGKGYWIKVNAPGQFVLASGPAPEKAVSSGRGALESMNSITIKDALGRSQTLYFGTAKEAMEYAMPPLPPEGAFDARFTAAEGGAIGKTHAAGAALPISIQSAVAPLTVSWSIRNGEYVLDAGQGLKPVAGEGTLTLGGAVSRLMLRSAGLGVPAEFALMQNYPNPFNPSTTIRFGLPVEARVTVRVFNLLGQQVREIAGGVLKAGYHEAAWDGRTNMGASVGSGVYFYRLEAVAVEGGRSFSDMRKMMLLK